MACKDNKIYEGTKLKYLLNIEGDGFDMDAENFDVTFVGEKGTVKIRKSDMVSNGNGKYYVLVNTALLGAGVLKAVVTAHISDPDFPDGLRDEVYVIPRLDVIYEA